MYIRLLTVALALSAMLAACGSGAAQTGASEEGDSSAPSGRGTELSGEVVVDGSSTVFPISEAMAEEFGLAHPAVRVLVGVSGTGGGFEKFCNGEISVSGASRPIKEEEIAACQKQGVEFIELPVAFDGIAVVANPQNTWAECVTVDDLKRVWEPEAQGKVSSWQQIREGWPAESLTLYGPGTDSGTFDYFTEAIVGESGASRGDYTASEDDNLLVQGVAGDTGGLGYFGYAYYSENQDSLRLLAVDNGSGCVKPDETSISAATYQPLSRPIFIYARKDALDRPEVAAFVDFYLSQATQLVGEVGYVALPQNAYTLAAERVAQRVTGSVFKDAEIGVSIEDLLSLGQ